VHVDSDGMVGVHRSSAKGGLGRELLRDPMQVMTDISKSPTPVVKSRAGLIPIFFVTDPALAIQVLQTDVDTFRRNPLLNHIFKTLSGDNLFTTSGEAWAWRRRAISPAFRSGPLTQTIGPIVGAIDAEIAGWPRSEPVDVQPLTMNMALAAAAGALFGAHLSPDRMSVVRDAMDSAVGWINHRLEHPLAGPAFLPTNTNRSMRRGRAAIEAMILELIEERRATPGSADDVLERLINATDPDSGQELTESQIGTEAFVLLFAGHETTASAAAWAMELLACNPEVQDRARAEIDVVLDGHTLGSEQLTELQYVRAVIDETLRLFPPAWGIPRMPYRTTNLGPARIRRFSPVIVAVAAIHRNPKTWHEPERFDPARFLHASDRPPASFQPFGLGPRQCVGARFATNELLVFLATILSQATVSPATDQPATPDAAFGLRAKGSSLIFEPR